MTTPDPQASLAAAIRRHREAAGMSQEALGAAVARHEDRPQAYGQSTVQKWEYGEVDEDLAVLFVVAAGLGARRGELCGLRWCDVDLATGVVQVRRNVVEPSGRLVVKDPKTHQARHLTLPGAARAALVAHRARMAERAALFDCALAESGYVFSRDPDGERPLRPSLVTRAFAEARTAAKLPDTVRLHDLRHLNASLQMAAGVDPATVAARLGHAQISTTLNIYTHAQPSGDAAAVAALDRLLG